jgi:hypothetical protein
LIALFQKDDDYQTYEDIMGRILDHLLVRGRVSTTYIHTLKITNVNFKSHPDSRSWNYLEESGMLGYENENENEDEVDRLKTRVDEHWKQSWEPAVNNLKTLIDEHWRRHWKSAGLPLKYCILGNDEPDDDPVPWIICGKDDDSEDDDSDDEHGEHE